jgi:hypothetical protein
MRVLARKKTPSARVVSCAGARELEAVVKRRLLASVGAERYRTKDVSAYISERFFETFSLRGAVPESEQTTHYEAPPGGEFGVGGLFERPAAPEDTEAWISEAPENAGFASAFRQVALERGELIGAVLRGGSSAKYMLLSCLKRAASKTGSENFRRRRPFRFEASLHVNLEGGDRGEVIFDHGKSEGAVAVALKSVRSVRNTLETLTTLAEGRGGLPEDSGAAALRELYPFLDDGAERRDIETYAAMTDELGDAPENEEKRLVLRRAQFKAQAVIEHKARLRSRFLGELMAFSEKAEKAEAFFNSEELRREARLTTAQTAPIAGEAAETPTDGAAGDESGVLPENPPDGVDPDAADNTERGPGT